MATLRSCHLNKQKVRKMTRIKVIQNKTNTPEWGFWLYLWISTLILKNYFAPCLFLKPLKPLLFSFLSSKPLHSFFAKRLNETNLHFCFSVQQKKMALYSFLASLHFSTIFFNLFLLSPEWILPNFLLLTLKPFPSFLSKLQPTLFICFLLLLKSKNGV